MQDIFTDLLNAIDTSEKLKGYIGRVPGVQLGICTEREDPLGLGRIKVTLAAMGAKTNTDWLTRIEPCPGLSLPVPNLGDTVLVSYIDGDPNQGVYFGVLQNRLNPASAPDMLLFSTGSSSVAINPDIITLTVGSTSLTISDGSVSINGQQIATVGAVDTDGDTLVEKGWSNDA